MYGFIFFEKSLNVFEYHKNTIFDDLLNKRVVYTSNAYKERVLTDLSYRRFENKIIDIVSIGYNEKGDIKTIVVKISIVGV